MTIKLELSVEEVNQVLQALAKLPFETVNDLIGKIHRDGSSQLSPPTTEGSNLSPDGALGSQTIENSLDG